jgi:hypothetical protein
VFRLVTHSLIRAFAPAAGLYRRSVWRCLLVAVAVSASRAADDSVILLPPLEVSAALQTNPWRYAALPGLEVLSSCSESTTRAFIAAEYRLEQLFAALVPAEFQVRLSVPKIVVLSEQKRTLSASQDLVAGFGAAEGKAGKLPADEAGRARAAAVRFMPNLRLADPDLVVVFAVIDEEKFDSEQLGLTSDYVRFALDHRTPPLPAWLVDGFTQLSATLGFSRDTLSFAADDDDTSPEGKVTRIEPNLPNPLLPLAELFERPRPADPAAAVANTAWRAQAALFIRWAFDGDDARQDALWNFVARAGREPVTEAVFEECFHAGYEDVGKRLTAYVQSRLRNPVYYRPDEIAPLPKYVLRLATEAEIGRIKGDWERLEIAYVKSHFPQYTVRYEEQATRTLKKGLNAAPQDPQLLAVMGLQASDAGKNDPAREMLEAAVRGGVARPRVHFELARLRYVAALAQPAGPEGRLDATQVNGVLEALRAAHALQPPLPQTYVLAAEAWARGGVRLLPQHWSLLEEGLRLFPRNAGLIYQLAALKALHGSAAEAKELIERGLQLNPPPAGRAEFEKLRAAMANGG